MDEITKNGIMVKQMMNHLCLKQVTQSKYIAQFAMLSMEWKLFENRKTLKSGNYFIFH